MKTVSLIHADSLLELRVDREIDGQWVLARPLGMAGLFHRMRLAWLVFTGRCDALKWTKQ